MSASVEWMSQFNVGGGAPVLDCACGRTHVAIDSDDLPADEAAEHTSKEGPRHVLHRGVDYIHEHTFAGMTIVDCCSCGRMAMIERMVSAESTFILGYFRALALKAEAAASELRSGLDGVSRGESNG